MVAQASDYGSSLAPPSFVPAKRRIFEVSEAGDIDPKSKIQEFVKNGSAEECSFPDVRAESEVEAVPEARGQRRRNIRSDKRKNIFCSFYQGGCCALGDDCDFDHQEITKISGYKTRRCADYVYRGTCQNDACFNAHGDSDLRTPPEWVGYPGYKKAFCSYYARDDLICSESSYRCFDAHGYLDLRKEPLTIPRLNFDVGATYTCIEDTIEIWASISEWEQIGELAMGSKVTSSGEPEKSDGYVMLPIEPRGAVEMRYVQIDDSIRAVEQSFEFADAHLHLDQIILSRLLGAGWMHKTLPCRYDSCPFGKSYCMYAHGTEDMKPRPPYSDKDFLALVDDMCAIPGSRFVGCVHSCCEIYSIEETLRLVEWGREKLDGRVYVAFGIHPSTFEQYTPEVERRMEEALDRCGAQGVAWGECGLDYFKKAHAIERDPGVIDSMKAVFVSQIQVALRRGLPLVVHSRDAIIDTFALLRENLPVTHPVYLHSFMGTAEEMLEFVNEWPNGYIGITGAVNWPLAARKGGLMETARAVPLDRLLLETDGPFMAPYPHRGEPSHPGMIPQVAAGVARSRGPGLSVEEVLEVAIRNFRRFYRLESASCTDQPKNGGKVC